MVIFFMMVTIAARIVVLEKKGFTDALKNKGESLAKFMAKVAPASMLTYDVLMLDKYAKEMTKDKEVIYALISDKKGKLLSMSLNQENSLIAGLKDKKDNQAGLLEEIRGMKDVIEIETPIIYENRTIGAVRVGLTKQVLNKKIKEQLLEIIIVSLIGIILAIIAIAAYVRKGVVSPLNKDVSFAYVIASGDMTQRLDVKSNDEIGMLGKSLNKMAVNLKEMVNKIQISSTDITEATRHIDMDKLTKGSELQAKSIDATSVATNEMNSSIKSVANTAENLFQSATESSSAILEMTASIEEVAKSTDTLSTTVQNSSSSVEEMTASIKQVSTNLIVLSDALADTSATVNEFAVSLKSIDANVHESAILTEQVKKDASESGLQAIKKTTEGMNRIIKSADKTSSVVSKLGDMSSQIGNILKVISGVADKTSLLSLNAAIIAAQAGEQGKSFAVVADEIRNLSDKTAYSTKEIASVIEAVRGEIEEAVSSIKEVSDNAGKGMKLTEEAGDVLNKIVESSDRSSRMAWEIEKATKEQANGVVQINESIVKFSDMMKQITRATKEMEKGTEQILIAVEEVKATSQHVRTATVEQTKGSRQIDSMVEDVNSMAQSIAEATKEQINGSDHVVKEMDLIKEITQQNLAIASEVKNAVDTLIRQAELLQTEIKRFTI
ncbi:methyl-accepting chemotaxis protein McpA [bacterium BMS3Abin07]|nr:methyl-accepting chemotaxis protein McpA [bacterium BMS3Abin07]GBE31229.1 methyl-accepting chemotaxis protein McpA [bacterium BMS3Bbin05]HDO23506.1 methyl-accepting chemotaxis protein [Nitrospirota bacterium]HDZ88973.1 methyl-accepting chemotaxis protein [Nitrospirota bacterium]